MQYIIILFLLLYPSLCNAAPSITYINISGVVDHGDTAEVVGSGFGTKTNNGEGRSNLCWIWDNSEDYATFADAGWTSSQCVPSSSISSAANIQYSTGVLATQPHSNSTKYITGSHYADTGFSSGANVSMFAGGTDVITKVYGHWYYYEEAPFTKKTVYNVLGSYDIRNNKNITFQDRDSLYAGGGTGLSYSYIDNQGLTVYTTAFSQIWIPTDYPLHCYRSIHHNGFGTTSGTSYGVIPNGGRAGYWEKWEFEANLNYLGAGSLKVWINNTLKINITNTSNPFALKGIGIGGYRDRSNDIDFRKYFDDIYIDKSWQRVVICNNQTYTSASIKEVQIPTVWADGSITVKLNQGQLPSNTTCYMFVVDNDGTVSNGRAITFGQESEPPPAVIVSIETVSYNTIDNGDEIIVSGQNFGDLQGNGKVEIVNNSDYSSATVVVQQVINSWSDISINMQVQQGTLVDGTTGWLFVSNNDGYRSSVGYPVNFTSIQQPSTVDPTVSSVIGSMKLENDILIKNQ